jgi:hypothetical protein
MLVQCSAVFCDLRSDGCRVRDVRVEVDATVGELAERSPLLDLGSLLGVLYSITCQPSVLCIPASSRSVRSVLRVAGASAGGGSGERVVWGARTYSSSAMIAVGEVRRFACRRAGSRSEGWIWR